ncbi:MAG: hypothetical protein ACI8ZF_000958 [Candidatus Midichloriaceae bacterium]|jgi:hypothetical protein
MIKEKELYARDIYKKFKEQCTGFSSEEFLEREYKHLYNKAMCAYMRNESDRKDYINSKSAIDIMKYFLINNDAELASKVFLDFFKRSDFNDALETIRDSSNESDFNDVLEITHFFAANGYIDTSQELVCNLYSKLFYENYPGLSVCTKGKFVESLAFRIPYDRVDAIFFESMLFIACKRGDESDIKSILNFSSKRFYIESSSKDDMFDAYEFIDFCGNDQLYLARGMLEGNVEEVTGNMYFAI